MVLMMKRKCVWVLVCERVGISEMVKVVSNYKGKHWFDDRWLFSLRTVLTVPGKKNRLLNASTHLTYDIIKKKSVVLFCIWLFKHVVFNKLAVS